MNATKPYKGLAMEGPIARWYAGTTNNDQRHKEMAELVSRRLQPKSRVLEIAPGPGYFSILLAGLGDYQITGLDISRTFVEMARDNARRAGVAVDFRSGNAAGLPFDDQAFDFTFCQAAFKNFTQPVRAIAEMHRVLVPGGTSLIVDLRRDATLEQIDRYIDGLGHKGLNRAITRMIFQYFLLKNAHSLAEMESFVAQTPFGRSRFDQDEIGFALWLEK